MPKPVTPENAIAKCASGKVSVDVLVSEEGTVLKAKAIAGHQLLRSAAESAARRAKFGPIIDALPARFRGIIIYNFPVPDSCSVKPATTVSFPFCSDCVSLNAKPVEMPKPIYPPAALAVNVSGQVEVRVYINELGKVVSTEVISGHPFLRAAALKAAKGSTFEPIIMNGEPMQWYGVITYNFSPSETGVNEKKSANRPTAFDITVIKSVIPKFNGCNCKLRDNERVLIEFRLDGDGTVDSALAITGHGRLREIARRAVLGSKFDVAHREWNGTYITGHVYYDFQRVENKWRVSVNGYNFSTN